MSDLSYTGHLVTQFLHVSRQLLHVIANISVVRFSTVAEGHQAGEHSTSRGRTTGGSDIDTLEHRTLRGQPFQCRCTNLPIPHKVRVVRSQIIGDDKNNMGLVGSRCRHQRHH